MPTSVLLAVLAGAGLLALAPALVRRYDADERIAADREQSDARVLERNTKGRTGPGDNPVNPPSTADDTENAIHAETPRSDGSQAEADPEARPATRIRRRAWERNGARKARSVTWTATRSASQEGGEAAMTSARLRSWWQQRYRRVLYVLLALVFVEILGVIIVGPGFWLGVAISVGFLLAFLRFLRMRAIRESHRRPRRPALAHGRQVYVPPQADGEEAEPDTEPGADYDDPGGLVPGFGDDDGDAPEDAPEPPPRRRTGGIRGRSYESPANM